MTQKSKQIRAVALAALMVLSVFAGTIAFAGSATAAGSGAPRYVGDAVHYNSDSDGSVIEVPFDEEINSTSLTTENFTLLNDGKDVTSKYVAGNDSITQPVPGRVVIQTNETIKSQDLEIQLSGDIKDNSSTVKSLANAGKKKVVFAAVTVDADSDRNSYKGSLVAVETTNVSEDVEVTATSDENSDAFSRNTGTNSTVIVFNTKDRALGEYQFEFEGASATTTVRDLGLNVTLDSQNITTDGTVDGTVSANAGNRDVKLQLLDSDGEEVANITGESLNGQGQYDFSFSSVGAGSYTVKATDLDSGVTAKSSTVNVKKAGKSKANFNASVISQQRGDIVEIPVMLSNTEQAVIDIGSEDAGFHANVTVEDGNNDGKVTLLFNTWTATDGVSGDVFTVENSDDSVVDLSINTDVGSLLDAGDYDLEIRTKGASNPQNVATLTLEERSTNAVTTWTASDGTNLSDIDALNEALANGNVTQDSEIANGDRVITQVNASGLGGVYEANGNFLGNEQFKFSVNQTTAPANGDAFWLDLTSENTNVIADAENDTYFIVFDTGSNSSVEAIREVNGSSVDYGAGDGLTANFTVKDESNLADSQQSVETDFELVEAKHSLDEPVNVSNAASQTIEGESNVAPGTELQIRVRSSEDTSPSFLKTATVYVSENNTFSADFDFSNQNVGDKFTVRVTGGAAGDVTEVKGNVVEGANNTTETVTDNGTVTTQGPNETATTDTSATTTAPATTSTGETTTAEQTGTDTSTPGFGVVVAVIALLAAALFAVRRD
ncbi:BGTF surface domain-containing protein [Halopelagius fulvigenes]|uniref:BGTF surface domain-containing protein n=1 Tax=Halopelagius fulvigenes TaxID=1198324 RepID=A0ABD5TWH8_9EURY